MGNLLRTIPFQPHATSCYGMAVSHDGTLLAVSSTGASPKAVALFSLPSGDHLRSFATRGSEPGQLKAPRKLCFAVNGSSRCVPANLNLLLEV